jgi:hypothetical protein
MTKKTRLMVEWFTLPPSIPARLAKYGYQEEDHDETRHGTRQAGLGEKGRKGQWVGREIRQEAVQAKIERGTENIALANPEDVPGISRWLARRRGEAQGGTPAGPR